MHIEELGEKLSNTTERLYGTAEKLLSDIQKNPPLLPGRMTNSAEDKLPKCSIEGAGIVAGSALGGALMALKGADSSPLWNSGPERAAATASKPNSNGSPELTKNHQGNNGIPREVPRDESTAETGKKHQRNDKPEYPPSGARRHEQPNSETQIPVFNDLALPPNERTGAQPKLLDLDNIIVIEENPKREPHRKFDGPLTEENIRKFRLPDQTLFGPPEPRETEPAIRLEDRKLPLDSKRWTP